MRFSGRAFTKHAEVSIPSTLRRERTLEQSCCSHPPSSKHVEPYPLLIIDLRMWVGGTSAPIVLTASAMLYAHSCPLWLWKEP